MENIKIEEKAQRYDEALERAKELLEIGLKDTRDKRVVLSFFPELKESEDEKIRKHLITLFKNEYGKNSNARFAGIKVKDIIAWLKKKGEQRDILEDATLDNNEDGLIADTIKTKGEQKPTEWSEEDIETIERIVCILDGIRYYNTVDNKQEKPYQSEIDWLKSLKDRIVPQSKQVWKQENTHDLTDFENVMMHIGDSFFGQYAGLDPNDTIAIKEQATILLGLVPKQEWSEEDENRINRLIAYFEDKESFTAEDDVVYANWLKSLRHQNKWKPSDEHYELEEFAKIVRGNLTGISKAVQKLFEAKYLQLTGNKMYGGFKD